MNWSVIYLLSIIDNIELATALIGSLLSGAAIILASVFTMSAGERNKDIKTVNFKFPIKMLVVGMIFIVIAVLVPNRRTLVSSYLIYEGSKIVTAENGEKAVEAFVKRVDIFLDKYAK